MKIIDDFKYERPSSRREALELLEQCGEKASPLAGGTDLVVGMKYRSILQLVEGAGSADARYPAARRVPPINRPEVVVSLALLDDLTDIVFSDASSSPEDGKHCKIGPCVTMTELAEAPSIENHLPALADAARIMGSPLIRNRATLGGNLVNGRPAADTAIAALALGASLELSSVKGVCHVAADGFFTGPGETLRRPDELLTGVEFSVGKQQGSAYFRQGTRRQLEIALASAAAWLKLSPGDGTIQAARIAMGAVGPTPLLAKGAANSLLGQKPSVDLFKRAALMARDEARPIDDYRGSADYRREIVQVLVSRALSQAAKRAEG